MTFFLVSSIIKIVVVFTVIMVGVALLTLAERRICAWMQDRLGPNRVGPQGLLQPAADGLKNLVKEETLPAQADKVLFMLAPAISFIPALLTFAVIPFAAPPHTVGGSGHGRWRTCRWDSSTFSPSARWACMASCWRDGRQQQVLALGRPARQRPDDLL